MKIIFQGKGFHVTEDGLTHIHDDSIVQDLPFKAGDVPALVFRRDISDASQLNLFGEQALTGWQTLPVYQSGYTIDSAPPEEAPSAAQFIGAFLQALIDAQPGPGDFVSDLRDRAERLEDEAFEAGRDGRNELAEEAQEKADDLNSLADHLEGVFGVTALDGKVEGDYALEADEQEFLDIVDELEEIAGRLDVLAESPVLSDWARENAFFISTVINNAFHSIQDCD